MIIDLVDETNQLEEHVLKNLEELLNFAAKDQGIPDDAEVSVTFVTNEVIQKINKEYRGKDQPTDVISFALEESSEEELEIKGANIPRILGDIIVSVERANEQAEDYGHTVNRELGFLCVHGFLHLLGYDHMNQVDEENMIQKQKEILDAYGLKR